LETLFDSIIEDMSKEGFTVGDKYKLQYEELGKEKMLGFSFFSVYSLKSQINSITQ
jgi:hypothetical protein